MRRQPNINRIADMIASRIIEQRNEGLSSGIDIHSQLFKRWFGDWENEPETASKVVDDNGVPLKVTHLTRHRWETDEYRETDEETFIWGYVPNENDTRFPAWGDDGLIEMKFYFNLRNPLIIDAEGVDSDYIQGTKWGLPYDGESAQGVAMCAYRKGYDGVIIKNVCDVTSNPSTDIIAFYPNQIMKA